MPENFERRRPMITVETPQRALELTGEDFRNATVLDAQVYGPMLVGLLRVGHAVPCLFVEFYRRLFFHQVNVLVQAFQQVVEEF